MRARIPRKYIFLGKLLYEWDETCVLRTSFIVSLTFCSLEIFRNFSHPTTSDAGIGEHSFGCHRCGAAGVHNMHHVLRQVKKTTETQIDRGRRIVSTIFFYSIKPTSEEGKEEMFDFAAYF